MLCSVCWELVPSVAGRPISPIVKCQAVKKECQATGESAVIYGMLLVVIGSYRGKGADEVAGALRCYRTWGTKNEMRYKN
jgi:hypothetical protein